MRRKRGRAGRVPLGHLSANELVVHRELEYLRCAGRRMSRQHLARRWRKLQAAYAIAGLRPAVAG